jgi:hypothetical protein
MSGSVIHLNHPYNATRVNVGRIDDRVAELQKETGPTTFGGEKGRNSLNFPVTCFEKKKKTLTYGLTGVSAYL